MVDDHILISSDQIDVEANLRAFQRVVLAHTTEVGAIASFSGLVRGGDTDQLVLEHYAPLSNSMVMGFCAEARRRFDVTAVSIQHRVGMMHPGDVIVFVAAASAHRRAAFDAVDFLMDRLKSDAPFWKQQLHNGVTQWIEPTDEDRRQKARWSDEV